MPYADYEDLVTRFRPANEYTPAEVNSGFIYQAEVIINAGLSGRFTVPFTDPPPLIKELTCMEAKREMLANREDTTRAKATADRFNRIMGDLVAGTIPLVTASGTQVWATESNGLYSTSQDYANTFNMLDHEEQRIDPDRQDDERDDVYE